MPKSRSRRRPSGARSRPRPRPGPSAPLVPKPAPGPRGKVERLSAPALLWLSARPKFLLPIVTVMLLVVGLAAPTPVGVPVLALLVLLIGSLSYLSWPVVEGAARLVRLATIGLLIAAIAGRLSA